MCCEASRLNLMYPEVYVCHVFSNVVVLVSSAVGNEADGKQFSAHCLYFMISFGRGVAVATDGYFTLCDSR